MIASHRQDQAISTLIQVPCKLICILTTRSYKLVLVHNTHTMAHLSRSQQGTPGSMTRGQTKFPICHFSLNRGSARTRLAHKLFSRFWHSKCVFIRTGSHECLFNTMTPSKSEQLSKTCISPDWQFSEHENKPHFEWKIRSPTFRPANIGFLVTSPFFLCDTENVEFEQRLTFNADNMFPDLLLDQWIRNSFYQIIDGIDGGVNALKTLDFLTNGKRVAQVRLHMSSRIHDALNPQSKNKAKCHIAVKTVIFSVRKSVADIFKMAIWMCAVRMSQSEAALFHFRHVRLFTLVCDS